MNDEKHLYQTVTLVLADGRKVVYSGPANIDPSYPPKVVEILISRPRPLPDGMTWGLIPKQENAR